METKVVSYKCDRCEGSMEKPCADYVATQTWPFEMNVVIAVTGYSSMDYSQLCKSCLDGFNSWWLKKTN